MLFSASSSYLDLVSTGNLSLIRDAALRDQIVDFYQVTDQRFEVFNRNNSYFVDNVYNTNVIMSGLVQFRLSSNQPAIALDVATMAEKLGLGRRWLSTQTGSYGLLTPACG